MKKQYVKPEINTKAYAQFENVFTACNKNPGRFGCRWSDDINEPGFSDSSHISLYVPPTSN